MTKLRVIKVNILQLRACHTLQLDAFEHINRFSATKSFAINCQNVLESTPLRHEHTTSEIREIFVFNNIHQRNYWNQLVVAEVNLFMIKLDK